MGYTLIVKINGKKVGQKSLGRSVNPTNLARAKREWKDDHKYDAGIRGKRCSYDVVYR